MPVFIVPELDEEPYPSLGPQVCAFIEAYLVFGPGDLRGQPAKLDGEKKAIIYRAYEVFPPGHAQAGRRRFNRVCISVRKGWAKTEVGAWIVAVELHPDGPVRCDGFDADGQPVGIGVRDPYIPMLAYTEEQSDELGYAALKVALEEGPLAGDFHIYEKAIIRRDGTGRAVSLATTPNSRDGARTTFQLFDETHRLTLPKQRQAHKTMLANMAKRALANPWALEITTSYSPGENSVAETTHDYARQVADGKIPESRLFFFHRQAADGHLLDTPDDVRQAVLEASGPVAAWSDVETIVGQFFEPDADRTYLERVWLNRPVRSADRAFDLNQWRACVAVAPAEPPSGTAITLGFDGARTRDATALVATTIATGYQWPIHIWERPPGLPPDVEWETPADEVSQAVEAAFSRWKVALFYADPPFWQTQVSEWAGKYGDKVVREWWTTRQRPMAAAIKAYNSAIANGELSHSGDPQLTAHIGNAVRRVLTIRDESAEREQDKVLWLMQKERPDSPHKMDAAMAGCLSWEARMDAIADGAANEGPSVYEERGLLIL